MAKRIHRKKIHEDEFVRNFGRFLRFVEQNRRQILQIALGVALIALLALAIGSYFEKSRERSQAALDEASSILAAGKTAGEEKESEARTALEAILRDYPSAEAAVWARYYLGRIALNDGDALTAKKMFQEFLDRGPKSAHTIGLTALGYAHRLAGENDEAIRIWQDLQSDSLTSELLQFETALVQLKSGENQAGLETLQRLAESGTDQIKRRANETLAMRATDPDESLRIPLDPAALVEIPTNVSEESVESTGPEETDEELLESPTESESDEISLDPNGEEDPGDETDGTEPETNGGSH